MTDMVVIEPTFSGSGAHGTCFQEFDQVTFPQTYQPFSWWTWPVYQSHWIQEQNKTEQAFKVVQKLMKRGMIQVKSAKQFIDAVNGVAECL